MAASRTGKGPPGPRVTGAPGGGGEEGGWRLPRARRITRSREIRTLFQRGKRSRTAHLDVFASASPAGFCRAGLVVGKQRHTGAERNRLKRRVRTLLRTLVLPGLERQGEAVDVLVRARKEAYDASFATLLEELKDWLDRRGRRAH